MVVLAEPHVSYEFHDPCYLMAFHMTLSAFKTKDDEPRGLPYREHEFNSME